MVKYLHAEVALSGDDYVVAQRALNQLRHGIVKGLHSGEISADTIATLFADAYLSTEPYAETLRLVVDLAMGQAQIEPEYDVDGFLQTNPNIRMPLALALGYAYAAHPRYDEISDLPVTEVRPECFKPLTMLEFGERYNPAGIIELEPGLLPFKVKEFVSARVSEHDTNSRKMNGDTSNILDVYAQTRAFARYVHATDDSETRFLSALKELIAPNGGGLWVNDPRLLEDKHKEISKRMVNALDLGKFSEEFLAKAYDALRADIEKNPPDTQPIRLAKAAIELIIARRILSSCGKSFSESCATAFAAIESELPEVFHMDTEKLKNISVASMLRR